MISEQTMAMHHCRSSSQKNRVSGRRAENFDFEEEAEVNNKGLTSNVGVKRRSVERKKDEKKLELENPNLIITFML